MPITDTQARTVSPRKGRNDLLRPSGLLITVKSGSDDAVPIALGVGKFRFGSSVSCDYLLSGVEIPVLFSLEAGPGGVFAVEAHERLTIDGAAVSAGETRSDLRVASIAYADLVISVQSPRRSFPNRAAVAVIGALVLAAPLTYGLGLHASVAPSHIGGPSSAGPNPARIGMTSAASPTKARSAIESTREYLAMLGYAVAVQEDEQGRYHVSGNIHPEQQPLLKDALKGLRPHGEVVWSLGGGAPPESSPTAAVAPAPKTVPPPKLSIVSIALRPKPTIVTKGGNKLFTGAQLKDGWTITRIGLDAIDVKNGAQTHRLDF